MKCKLKDESQERVEKGKKRENCGGGGNALRSVDILYRFGVKYLFFVWERICMGVGSVGREKRRAEGGGP